MICAQDIPDWITNIPYDDDYYWAREEIMTLNMNESEYKTKVNEQALLTISMHAMKFLADKGLTDITILEDRGGILARPYGVNSFLPRLFVIDKYQIVQMDEGGLCPTCIQDEVGAVLDKLINE